MFFTFVLSILVIKSRMWLFSFFIEYRKPLYINILLWKLFAKLFLEKA